MPEIDKEPALKVLERLHLTNHEESERLRIFENATNSYKEKFQELAQKQKAYFEELQDLNNEMVIHGPSEELRGKSKTLLENISNLTHEYQELMIEYNQRITETLRSAYIRQN